GQIAILHEAADDQANGRIEQIVCGKGEDIEGNRQQQTCSRYPGDGAGVLLVDSGRQPAGGEGADGSRQGDRRVDPDGRLAGGNFVGTHQKQRLERGNAVTTECGDGGTGGHQPESRLAQQLMDGFTKAG